MGGDEFAAVFHAATPPLIQSLAEWVCTAVREHMQHAAGTNRIPATISIGAAFFDAGTQTHHEALRAADTALHEAKVRRRRPRHRARAPAQRLAQRSATMTSRGFIGLRGPSPIRVT